MSLVAATAKFTPSGNLKAVLDVAVMVRVFAAVSRAQGDVAEEARRLCPVNTGALRESIIQEEISDNGKQVTGSVSANTEYAAYVEFGTGARGAGSPGAGPFSYTTSWPGQVAQPYMRPALDNARAKVLEDFSA